MSDPVQRDEAGAEPELPEERAPLRSTDILDGVAAWVAELAEQGVTATAPAEPPLHEGQSPAPEAPAVEEARVRELTELLERAEGWLVPRRVEIAPPAAEDAGAEPRFGVQRFIGPGAPVGGAAAAGGELRSSDILAGVAAWTADLAQRSGSLFAREAAASLEAPAGSEPARADQLAPAQLAAQAPAVPQRLGATHGAATEAYVRGLRGLVDGAGYRLVARSVGMVKQIGDGVALVSGLQGVMVNELVVFADGTYGLAMNLSENIVGCVLLGPGEGIQAGDIVVETGRVIDVPVGEALLGRVVDALGRPIDDRGPLDTDSRRPIEFPAPGFVDRTPVNTPLQTGLKAIDSIIPLGRGQRELIIGDRQVGKTAIAVDAVLNQRGQGVRCIYVCISQKMSTVAQIVDVFRAYGALDYTTIVVASAEAPPSMAYLAPYAGCAMAEAFMYAGQDALIVYDDLSKHAVAYRQLSLLLQRPAGREAYPGDIFYIHSRLLERSARLSAACGGGSMTALPIVETQAGNIAAYIPTNLISITDGQIYLSSRLFDEGVQPAIDVGLSVSRVGGAAQNDAMRAVSRTLALDVAQYLELRVFSRFGTELDPDTRHQLARGERVRAILAQPQYEPLPVSHQVAMIYAAAQGYLDEVPVEEVHAYELRFLQYLRQNHGGLLAEFAAGHWYPELEEDLKNALTQFKLSRVRALEAARGQSARAR